MQIHYTLRETPYGLIEMQILGQERLWDTPLRQLLIGDNFVKSISRPEINVAGLYIRGSATGRDNDVANKMSSRTLPLAVLRELLETAVLVKDMRTKKMYESRNVCS